MKILALEGSAMVASVAILDDEKVIADYSTDYKKTHSQTLMTMIDAVLKMTDMDVTELDAIAVAKGPGSFTGIRIAASTAKGLGMALDKPVIGVSTLEAMAVGMELSGKVICPIIDARRQQVYAATFEYIDGKLVRLSEDELIVIDDLIAKLNASGREVIFLGDGVDTLGEMLKSNLTCGCTFAPAAMNRQRASYVAIRAREYYLAGKYESALEFLPEYLKETQAERELKEKKAGKNE